MVFAFFCLHHHVIDVALHQMVDQVIEDVHCGTLIGGIGILQPEQHDSVVEVAFRCPEGSVEGVKRSILIWF